MTVFSRDLAHHLIDASTHLVNTGNFTYERRRASAYLSLLACELVIKALLEKAGFSVKDIKKASHDLHKLSGLLGQCEVNVPACLNGPSVWGPASRFRAIVIKIDDRETTVGQVLDAEKQGASRYPQEIRYGGSQLTHFDPEALLNAALKLECFANQHWDTIRLPQP